MQPQPDEGLKRTIGVRTLAASAVNLTVGAGIFALPAVVASHVGGAAFLPYLFCTVLMLMVILCYVEAGSKIGRSGGVYAYVEEAFGRFPGFLASTLYGFGYCLIADAAIANVFADSLSVFVPALKEPVYRTGLMLLVFGGIGWINVLGVKQGVRLAVVITVAKLIPLFILIVVGLFFINPQHFKVEEWPTFSSLGEVSIILFFAFGGMECALSAGGEIENPKRTVPRGMLLGAFTVFILYMSVHAVTQGILGPDLVNHQEAPLASAAQVIMGNAGATLLILGAAISGLGLITGDILNSSRLPYAAARDGLLPKILARIHPKYATPYLSVILYAGLGFILSISGGFRQLAVISSVALLLTYGGVILATLKLRKRPSEPGAFKIPGGITIPLLALAATGWFLSNLSSREFMIAGIFLAVVAGVHGVMKLVRVRN